MKQLTHFLGSYTTKKMRVVFVLGFASGLPLALTDSLLQAWCTVAGLNLVTIGFAGLVSQPYVLKCLWAPLLDSVVLGGQKLWRVGWIRALQGALVLSIFGMAFLDPGKLWLLMALACVIATLSATQDLVIDAYRLEFLDPKDRSIGIGIAVGGYRLAMLVSGGIALSLAQRWGFQWTYCLMAVVMLCTMFFSWNSPRIQAPTLESDRPKRSERWLAPWKELGSRPHIFLVLAVILLYKLGDSFVARLSTAFFIRGLGFSLEEIGVAVKIVGLASTMIGIFGGGYILRQWGLYRALCWCAVLQAITNLGYGWLAGRESVWLEMVGVIFLEHLTSGMGTAALVAFLMSLCIKRFASTQFALLSALTAVAGVVTSVTAGAMVNSLGWQTFFFISFLIGFIPLFILWQLRKHYDFSEVENTYEASSTVM